MTHIVHIVDDDVSSRRATGRLLRAHGYVVEEYESADQFLERLRAGTEVGCILLDVHLPGLSGPDLQDRLSELGSPFPIVYLTGHGDIPTTVRAIKSGAEDFMTKPVPSEALLESIMRAFGRHAVEQKRQQRVREGRTLLESLTPREREVFDLIVQGKMNKQAAHALGITERTIKAHRERVMSKLGSRTIADLVSLAERLGIRQDPDAAEVPAARTGRTGRGPFS
jgi:FixJ family two-component response regulator